MDREPSPTRVAATGAEGGDRRLPRIPDPDDTGRARRRREAPTLADVLARCELPETPGFEEPQLARPIVVDISAGASDLEELKRRGVAVEISGRASRRANWVIYDEECEAFGQYRIEFRGEGNVCVLAGQTAERHELRGRTTIVGSNCLVVFGERTRPKSQVSLRLWGDDQVFVWGNGSTSNGSDFVLQGKGRRVLVGEDCMFATGIWVRTSDMHAIADLDTEEQVNKQTDIVLEPHVWVGQDALLLGCSRVGYGSVIGAKSLVTTDVEPVCIYGGVPARKLRENATWDRSATLRPETIEYVRELGRVYGRDDT